MADLPCFSLQNIPLNLKSRRLLIGIKRYLSLDYRPTVNFTYKVKSLENKIKIKMRLAYLVSYIFVREITLLKTLSVNQICCLYLRI